MGYVKRGNLSAVLRASGPEFDVDSFLRESAYAGASVYRRGEPRFPTKPESRKREESGITILVSNADFDDFPTQVQESIEFLEHNANEMMRLANYPGVIGVEIDFGVRWRETFTHSDWFPANLVKLAGICGIGLRVSHYPITDGTPES